jgi:hypothetical protein
VFSRTEPGGGRKEGRKEREGAALDSVSDTLRRVSRRKTNDCVRDNILDLEPRVAAEVEVNYTG